MIMQKDAERWMLKQNNDSDCTGRVPSTVQEPWAHQVRHDQNTADGAREARIPFILYLDGATDHGHRVRLDLLSKYHEVTFR